MSLQRNTSPPAPVLAELEKLLGFQDAIRIPKTAWEHAKRCTSTFQLVCDLYNFGYIMGQRAERQRKSEVLNIRRKAVIK